MTISPLSEKQLKELPQDWSSEYKPVRYMCNGKSVNICTGHLVGGNIFNQMVYWDRPPEFHKMVMKFLRENNPNPKLTFRLVYSD